MSRAAAVLRDATIDDAPALVALWGDLMRRLPTGDQMDEMITIITRASQDNDQRITVAECDGEAIGAVLLRVTTLSPLNSEPVVQAISTHVNPEFRRRGVGRLLMEAAVQHAEEQGIGHVAAASLSSSRDAHRFLARMALAPQAVLRIAPTHVVRAKITGRRPTGVERRQPLSQVLAQRRSMRRQRDPA